MAADRSTKKATDEPHRRIRTVARCKLLDVLHAAEALIAAQAELEQSKLQFEELKREERERLERLGD